MSIIKPKKINLTNDYSIFKRLKGNRPVCAKHYEKMADSMRKTPELFCCMPIIVNEKLEIIDGQNRKEAYMIIGVPVPYCIGKGLTLKDAQRLNASSKPWSCMNYANSFVEEGNPHYITYVDFRIKYKLSHNVTLAYLVQGQKCPVQCFRSGKFKRGSMSLAAVLCSQVKDMMGFFSHGEKQGFSYAFMKLALNPLYNHEHMLVNTRRYGKEDISLGNDVKKNYEMLRDIYLKNSSDFLKKPKLA